MSASGPTLRDIHVPSAAWWPPALGWWVLAGLMACLAACIAIWFVYRHRHGALRALLREIDALEMGYARDGDAARFADGASRVLRRVARRIEPDAASTNGLAWRRFVRQYARTAAARQALDSLLDTRFRAAPVLDVPPLCAALRAWCRAALRRRPVRDGAVSVTTHGRVNA